MFERLGYFMKANIRKRALLLSLLLPFLLLLSACVNVEADFVIKEDKTVDFTVTLLDPQNNLTGDESSEYGRCENIIGDVENYTEDGDVKISPITEDGVAGCEVEGSDFTLDEVNALGYGEIVHSDDKYHVSTDGFTSILGDRGNTAQLSITFPGEITAAPGGELSNDDKTVTWSSPRSAEHMNAQAEDDDSSSSLILMFVAFLPIIIAIFFSNSQEEEESSKQEGSEKEKEHDDDSSDAGSSSQVTDSASAVNDETSEGSGDEPLEGEEK